MFGEFEKYRELEEKNKEAFCSLDEDEKREVAVQVLEKIKSRIETGNDPELCDLLACVVAPRASIKIDVQYTYIDVARPEPAKK